MMADHAVDAGAGAPRVAHSQVKVRRRNVAVEAPSTVLAPGDSAAHPPRDDVHWDLPIRAAIVLGLAALSWLVIGGGLYLLLHR